MKKASVIIISLLLVFTVVFMSGCEFEIGMGGEENTTQVAENGLPTGGKKKPGTTESAESDGKNDKSSQSSSSSGKKTLTKEEEKINKEFYTIKEDEKKDDGISPKRVKEAAKEAAKEDKTEQKKDEEAILSKKVYTIKGRMVTDGVTSEYKLAQSGNKYAVITAYNGTPLGLIIGDEFIYLMSYNDKTYMEIPLSLFESMGEGSIDQMLKESMVTTEDRDIKKEGTEKIDGKEYTFKEYEDGSIDYYSGSLIIMSKSADGTCVYYDEVLNEAPDSLFVPPTDYERVPLTADNIEKFTAVMGEGSVDE